MKARIVSRPVNRLAITALLLAVLVMVAAGIILLRARPSSATLAPQVASLFYVDNVLKSDCATYSLARRDCTGTDGTAYAGLNHALVSVPPTTTLQVRAGTYAESAKVPNGSTAAFFVNKPVTLETYRGEAVTLTYSDVARPDDGHGHLGVIVAIFSNNVTLEGFKIVGTQALGDNGSGDAGTDSDVTVYLRGVSGVTISNNVIAESGHAAIKADSLTGPLSVLNNDLAGGGFSARDHGVYISSRAEKFPKLIQGNSIHNFAGYGVHIYGGADITNIQIVRNHIYDNLTGGVLLTGANDTLLGNTIVDNRGGPFQQGGLVFNHFGLTGLSIIGNTITGNQIADINCQLDADTDYGGNTFSGNTWGTVKGGGTICDEWAKQGGTETPTATLTPISPTPTATATATPTDTPTPSATYTPTLLPLTETPTMMPTPFPAWTCEVLGVTPIAANRFRIVTECDP